MTRPPAAPEAQCGGCAPAVPSGGRPYRTPETRALGSGEHIDHDDSGERRALTRPGAPVQVAWVWRPPTLPQSRRSGSPRSRCDAHPRHIERRSRAGGRRRSRKPPEAQCVPAGLASCPVASGGLGWARGHMRLGVWRSERCRAVMVVNPQACRRRRRLRSIVCIRARTSAAASDRSPGWTDRAAMMVSASTRMGERPERLMSLAARASAAATSGLTASGVD
jgi:hypothetical protein